MTTRVLQGCAPQDWQDHFFGLSEDRWKTLSGQSFWVTGAATGFGYAMAYVLLAAGANVYISGRRESKLEEAKKEFSLAGLNVGNCQIVVMDVCSAESINAACEYIKAHCHALNGLIHSAALSGGMGSQTPLHDAEEVSWQAVMNTNVTGPWLLTQAIFSHLAKSNSPRVLFLSSEAGWAATPGVGVYNISKAALNSLGHSMAQEYAFKYPEIDIQMNTLIPGEAKSEMNRDGVDSPFTIVSMVLLLLSHSSGGPNGRFFHRDGRHFRFAHTHVYPHTLN